MPSPTSPGLPSRCSRCDGAEDRRRKAIYEELHPETKAGVAGASARWNGTDANENSAFASATSDAIGKSRRSVEIAAARGEALGDDLGAVTGTSLDKGVELDALAKLPKDEGSSAPFLLLPLCDASDRDASLGGAYRKHPTQIGNRRA